MIINDNAYYSYTMLLTMIIIDWRLHDNDVMMIIW